MVTTRDRIIVATNELFRRQGYNGTSLSAISEASGATTGSIYHFFPGGKEELAVAVIDSTAAVYLELFHAVVADAGDAATAIRTFFEAGAETLAESGYLDPCPIGGVAREVANTSEALRDAAARAFTLWTDAVATSFVAWGIPPSTAGELAEVVVCTLEGAFVVSRTHRSPRALLAAGEHLSRLVASSAKASRPRARTRA